jgi:hypothetical protein
MSTDRSRHEALNAVEAQIDDVASALGEGRVTPVPIIT